MHPGKNIIYSVKMETGRNQIKTRRDTLHVSGQDNTINGIKKNKEKIIK